MGTQRIRTAVDTHPVYIRGQSGVRDNASLRRRMTTMESSVRWASGRLIENEFADEMMRTISEFVAEIQTLTQQQVSHSYSAPTIRGRCGRPRYLISSEQLRFLLTFSFTTREIADILGVSKRTVKRRLRQFNLSLQSHYTNLTDSDLDERVQEVVNGNDELGVESVRARLIGIGVVVQRQRVWQSLNRIDPGAAAHRAMSHRLHRRTYSVAGPNSLWHLDGNHKLIRSPRLCFPGQRCNSEPASLLQCEHLPCS
ncbi:uncharacterized protein [Paramormyrops kingsleyae]|uniref:uncharacterized protein isoform X2 n=1 Tax=Paramormyrops kingsleyae TaxID=1676925 RepID=UPI003B977C10